RDMAKEKPRHIGLMKIVTVPEFMFAQHWLRCRARTWNAEACDESPAPRTRRVRNNAREQVQFPDTKHVILLFDACGPWWDHKEPGGRIRRRHLQSLNKLHVTGDRTVEVQDERRNTGHGKRKATPRPQLCSAQVPLSTTLQAANSLTPRAPSLPTPTSPKMAKICCKHMQKNRVLPGLEPGTSRN
ncbi:4048_t:CDS:2, partial [Scutellospora calospora]